MEKLLQMIPEIEQEEYQYIKKITEDLDDDQLKDFVLIYREKRKKRDTILIGTLIGFLGFGGIQRFMLDQIAMGILYLLTAGLCYIGTIVDLVNYRKLTLNYNRDAAYNAVMLVRRVN